MRPDQIVANVLALADAILDEMSALIGAEPNTLNTPEEGK